MVTRSTFRLPDTRQKLHLVFVAAKLIANKACGIKPSGQFCCCKVKFIMEKLPDCCSANAEDLSMQKQEAVLLLQI